MLFKRQLLNTTVTMSHDMFISHEYHIRLIPIILFVKQTTSRIIPIILFFHRTDPIRLIPSSNC